MNDTFSFIVPLEYKPGKLAPDETRPAISWLDGAGRETKIEAEAIRFTFRLFPPMVDEIAIETRHDEIAGGVANVVDLDQGIAQAQARLRRKYDDELWPEGREQTTNPEEAAKQQKLIDGLYAADQSTDRRALNRMERLQELHRVCAEWSTLIVGAPEEWADISNKPMRPGYAAAVVAAYTAAKFAEMLAAGK